MSNYSPVMSASEDVPENDISVKKQKIDHSVYLSVPDDFLDSRNGEKRVGETATPLQPSKGAFEAPREVRDCGQANVLLEVGADDDDCLPRSGHSSLISSPSRKTDAEPSDVEQEFQLPAMKMPEVFDFSDLGFSDRFDDIAEILSSRKPCEVEQAFADHVDGAVERIIGMDGSRSMQCVWRSPDLTGDVLVEVFNTGFGFICGEDQEGVEIPFRGEAPRT